MSDAFRQLLKEFPKSSVAAQANYYIGKAAFEAKDYKGALAPLDAARQLNKEQYYNLATLRIVSAFFYLKDRAALTKEVDGFLAANSNARRSRRKFSSGSESSTTTKRIMRRRRNISALLGQSESLGNVKPDFWFYLADTETKLKNFAAGGSGLRKISPDRDRSRGQGENLAGPGRHENRCAQAG